MDAAATGARVLTLSLEYRRGDFALEAAFEARTPGVLALFGRSGCGKTTLVNLIAGLLHGASGRIELDGETWFDSARGMNLPAEERQVGYVFQDARLFPHYDVRGNLDYGRHRRRNAGRGQALGFDEVVDLLGLAPLLSRRPASLSGGERQRVALGRALLSRPRLLLLDEPLASLDAARRDEVLPWLERLRDALAVPMIFVSHQFDEVLRLATSVVVLENGRVAAQGTRNEVSLSPALRAIVGPDAVGAAVDGPVVDVDPVAGLATLQVGQARLAVSLPDARVGDRHGVQLFARDIVLAVEEPRGVSVRNVLPGTVACVQPDGDSDLVHVDVGGPLLLARVTNPATRELGLEPGRRVWALVKAVSTRGHAY